MAATAAVASSATTVKAAAATVKTSTAAVEAAADMTNRTATVIELRMMALTVMSLPGMVLVEVRTIAPAISPTASPTI